MDKTTFEFPTDINMTQFISEQAHDLKSPFNRILGFTKVVLNGLDGPLNDTQKEDLTTVFQNSTYALTLISNLVDIARLSLGEKQYTPKDVEIALLFEQTIKAWQQMSPGKEVAIQTAINTSAPNVTGDEILLRQLLVNFMAYTVEYFSNPVTVQLSITDNGSKKLFTIQAEGQNKPGPSDCDLSMHGFIGQAIIKIHAGEIVLAESQEGKATIQFVLP